jgi:hypothetical protein
MLRQHVLRPRAPNLLQHELDSVLCKEWGNMLWDDCLHRGPGVL